MGGARRTDSFVELKSSPMTKRFRDTITENKIVCNLGPHIHQSNNQ